MQHQKTLYLLLILSGAILLVVFIMHFASLDHKIDAYLRANHFQGAVLVAQEGEVLFRRGYGHAHRAYQIPNTPQTLFRLGSVTKQFTACAILRLQEQGKLLVTDPINKYLPDYPTAVFRIITIHHLLSHTGGIPSITEAENLQEIQVHPTTARQTLNYFKDLPLDFTPGSSCYYSDSGYIVLGAIIEAITKRPYEEFLRTQFFEPLGMRSTFYEHSNLPGMATGYRKEELPAEYIDMSFPHAAGSLVSSVEDLYIWDRALKGNRFLSQESHKQLFSIHGSSKANRITYGYGFFIGPQNEELEEARSSIVGHHGVIEGFRAASYRYLDSDLTIILLSNVETTDSNALHLEIAEIVHRSWRP